MSIREPNQPALTDPFGRRIEYLRLSVTDRCDFRCVYCMAEEMKFLPRAQLCTLEELAEIGRAFVELGVNTIRVTGGEPLVRRNVMQMFNELGEIPQLEELTLTTNGSHLLDYAEGLHQAGVKRINVSLDSLQEARFRQLTRTGDLNQVLAGLTHARQVGFEAIKLNSVILRQRNFDEVPALVAYAVANGFDISFIEEMPLGEIDEHRRSEEFVASEELQALLEQHFTLTPSDYKTGGPSRYWQVAGQRTRVGFISPHSNNFCSSCNRVRVSAEGKLLLCLGNDHAADLKSVLRAHPGDRERLKAAIVEAIGQKPEQHHFDHTDDVQIVRFMNTTGG
ncbi:GTP 3',8-cyclase MoaA [Halioxenophilus sp. WMMB6]|uniref:GTP 3',8-cyclase MoaA n=1 Tax=Halioxenophilus sp. WMMB6 TaxID=3073815 RepID=UPI00295EA40D|nr:GTP 3',8-cyclase MoaA [Halioxenophilus sp. WMMB6]